MATLTDPRYVVTLDDCDSPCDVIEGIAAGLFASGELPWAHRVRMDRVRANASFLPEGAEVVRSAQEQRRRVVLARGDGSAILVQRWDDASVHLTVFAVDAEVGERVLAASTEGVSEPPPPSPGPTVDVGFWHLDRYAARRSRPIAVDCWADIRSNYSLPVAIAFDELMATEPADLSGRLLLLHGPPGTGKTTALRSLAHSWSDWCQFDYVIDPEILMSSPGYLMSVVLARPEDDDDERSWRLLLLEDCDELIRAGAKSGAGQALSRLLNLTDGLLGQGLDLVIAISTNEPLANLHPAVVRPGRCVAQIEVGPLTAAEATTWLGADGIASGSATLAELYVRKGEISTLAHREEPVGAGLYL